jgi:Zn-dependent M32 family carboxypeptidase
MSAADPIAPLREWLRENLHRHGRKFTPKETLQKAETVATSIAEMRALAYRRRRIAVCVKAAKPSVWLKE